MFGALERGQRNPTIVSLYELAQALGVDYLELLKPDPDWDKAKSRRKR